MRRFAGQVLIHALFNIRGGPDYTELARQGAEANVRMFKDVEKELADPRSHGTVSLPLNGYVGRYYNGVQTIYLEVCAAGTSLTFAVNGLKSQEYELRHYHFDTFSCHCSRGEQVKRARFNFGNGKNYLLQFQRNEEGRVESVNWAHDKMWPAGEVFSKDMGKVSHRIFPSLLVPVGDGPGFPPFPFETFLVERCYEVEIGQYFLWNRFSPYGEEEIHVS